jgi:hypothetical protein
MSGEKAVRNGRLHVDARLERLDDPIGTSGLAGFGWELRALAAGVAIFADKFGQ